MTDQIEKALEAAHKALHIVEEAWAEDADTVTSAAIAIDPRGARPYVAWPDRMKDFRQTCYLVEGLLDDHREEGTYSNNGWAKLAPETQAGVRAERDELRAALRDAEIAARLLINANERLRVRWQDAEAQIAVLKANLADTSGM
jgi:hypothetical protein